MEHGNKISPRSGRGCALALFGGMAALYFALFFTGDRIVPSPGTKIFLLLFSLICAALCYAALREQDGKMNRYMTKGSMLCVGLIALYASFASFGQRYFMEGNSRFHFSGPGLMYLLLGALWFVPVVFASLCLFERAAVKGVRSQKGSSRGFLILCAVIYSVWMGLAFLAFRPGGFPPDSFSQLSQAAGFDYIHDWHPALHTLLMRLILRLTGYRAMLIPAVQMLLFALLCAGWVSFIAERGCPKALAFVGGLVFLMLPSNVLSSVSAVKDFPYAMSLMWAVLLLCRLAENEGKMSLWLMLRLALALFFVYGFRHNGIIPALLTVLMLLIISVRMCKKAGKISLEGLKCALCALLTLSMILIYKGPVFAYFGVRPNTASPYTTMLCAVASCINKDLPLSDETEEIMASVIPLEDWAKYYDRYQGHDRYIWDRGEDAEFVTEHINAKMAFSAYFDALFHYPDVVIKDRLDGMDLMWDVVTPTDSWTFKSFDSLYYLDGGEMFFDITQLEEIAYGQYARPNALADMYRDSVNTGRNNVADMLLWRSGAHIIALIVLIMFIVKNRMGRALWPLLPVLGNIGGMMLLLYHQSYRYVYPVWLSVTVLVPALLLMRNSVGGDKNENC